MKRYTGQKALYEAISRSRGKTKPRSILERLRPEPRKPEGPPAQEFPRPVEPEQTPEQVEEPVVWVSGEPRVVETSPEQAVESEAQTDSGPAAPLEPLSEMTSEAVERVEPIVRQRPIERTGHLAPASPVQPWLRPRPVQINDGRIEVSVPYYVGVIAALVVLMVILAAFRLGQASGSRRANSARGQVESGAGRSAAPTNSPAQPTTQDTTSAGGQRSNSSTATAARQGAPARSQGDNWFVLATHDRQQDLENVKQHFAKYGIDLEVFPLPALRQYFVEQGLNPGVLPAGNGYMLVTLDSFDNPNTPGSDGYKMKQRIAEVGALYKVQAPPGSAPFAPNYFRDAYPMKIR